MNMWIKTPYPGDRVGEGVWVLCKTPYMKRLYKWTKLPKCKQKEAPSE